MTCLYNLIIISLCSNVIPIESLRDVLVNLNFDVPSLRNRFRKIIWNRGKKKKDKPPNPSTIDFRHILRGVRKLFLATLLQRKHNAGTVAIKLLFPLFYSALRVKNVLTYDCEYVQSFILHAKTSVFHYRL